MAQLTTLSCQVGQIPNHTVLGIKASWRQFSRTKCLLFRQYLNVLFLNQQKRENCHHKSKGGI